MDQKSISLYSSSDKGLWERYKKIKTIGQGQYGKIYKVKCRTTGTYYAAKKCKCSSQYSSINSDADLGVSFASLREYGSLVLLLANSHCPTIVPLIGAILHKQAIVLIFPLFDGDLLQLLRLTASNHPHKRFLSKKDIDSDVDTIPKPNNNNAAAIKKSKKVTLENYQWTAWRMKKCMYDIAYALACCHVHGIVHRDIKSANILIDIERDQFYLADFGLSKQWLLPVATNTHEVCTLWYKPPELLLGKRVYTTGIDIWSLGCVFYEIVTSKIRCVH